MSSRVSEAYQYDFYAWTITNAKLLREGKLEGFDIEHVAEELKAWARPNNAC